MRMMTNGWMIVKTLLKSSLDNYILPGTLTGTEILFVYMAQWKRHITVVTSAGLCLIVSQLERSKTQRVFSPTQSDSPQNG
jgi:hypothetical protein